MEIEYQLTEDEYLEAQLGYWRQARRVNLIRVEMVAFVLLAALLSGTQVAAGQATPG